MRKQIVGRICAKIAVAILRQLPAEQRAGVVDDLANVGVLTLYAATRGDLRVWAFEPAAVKARAAGPMPAAWIATLSGLLI